MQLPIAPATTPTTAQRPTAPAYEAALYGVDGDDDEHQRYHDENPAPAAAGQYAEGGAGVVDVHELEHTRDDGYGAGVERDVHRDPVFEPLVEYQDQHGGNGVNHSQSFPAGG